MAQNIPKKLLSTLRRGDIAPSWQQLRTIGNSRVVNLALYFPIIGYYIVYGKNFSEYFLINLDLLGGHKNYTGLVAWFIDISNLHALYFGMILLSIATIIYHLRCPSLVKYYNNAHLYVSENTQKRSVYFIRYLQTQIVDTKDVQRIWYIRWIESIQDSYGKIFEIDESTRQFETEIYQMFDSQPDPKTETIDGYIQSLAEELMLVHYSILSWSKLPARVVCTAFYLAGFLLASIGALQIAIRIVY